MLPFLFCLKWRCSAIDLSVRSSKSGPVAGTGHHLLSPGGEFLPSAQTTLAASIIIFETQKLFEFIRWRQIGA